MKRIPFIDIADVNCWMIYLMPFDSNERTDYDRVNALQQVCIKEKCFGMGWDVPCFEYGTPMTEKNALHYMETYNEATGWKVSEDAVYGYKAIKKGDYVIMRLKNGHYYVGCVTSDGAQYIYKENDEVYGKFSWGCFVDKWEEYSNDDDVPSEIVGRFSQRLHSTVQRIAPYRQRMFVISMYEKRQEPAHKRYEIPKLHISLYNFVRSLNYMELEDLVALFIAKKHEREGYRLLPSSCKISQQNYEFRFVAKGKKPITCQVKNQKEIKIEHYTKEDSYEHIYVFSGKWNEEQVLQKREEYKGYKQIYIITPSELYATLIDEGKVNNAFYDLNEPVLLPKDILLEGYIEKTKPNAYNEYTMDDDFICFMNKDGLFYSAEFGALILSYDYGYDKECIDKIIKDINR